MVRSPRAPPLDGLYLLLHSQALAGEGALIHLQAVALQQAPVRRYHVTGLQQYQVPYRDLPGRQGGHRPFPQHLGLGAGQRFQTAQRALCLHGLDRPQNRIHGDHDQDHHRALHVSQEPGDSGGSDQDEHQEVPELLQKDLGYALLFPLCQLIGSVAPLPGPKLLLVQGRGTAVDLFQDLGRCLLIIGFHRLFLLVYGFILPRFCRLSLIRE